MIPPEWAPVLQSLVAGTRAGAIDWEQQDSSQTFRVSLPGSTIVLRRYRTVGSSPDHGVRVQLLNDEGELVDSFEVLENQDEGERVIGLFESARRKALGIDVLLNRVASEVQQLRASARS